MTKFTYSIFDSNPSSSSVAAFPDHDDVEIEADSTEEAIEDVASALELAGADCRPEDGYSVGDTLYALVWDESGEIVGTPTYDLTHSDLGVATAEERLARAAKHVDATDLGDDRWAHYADETSRWYVVTADELEELCDYLDSDDPQVSSDAYSHWCAGTSGEEMPEGWTPDEA